ncbi:asparagine synthase (glutamine-hydrolyzing) [Lutimonas halocynthiae]|uniref:asparagine synthase (glutamine-hydrolyzing) n=1 Tax=Lutimonas halocynthiae TaxID=1446477 RepID=UPI0025B3B514|nr:asparagine synthase (glutamine-hydrolyzing) [Lutimonas halocynthiae]MDN3641074.1 asparagine synthase (glutamine-hydrolyzing) [Lutimonas halocynthiae]
MCGVAGFVDFSKSVSSQVLNKMTDVLNHRGPDDSGYSFNESKLANIGLGHRRLSILDLSKHGHQPMIFQNIEIVYNGEIYNFKEIRRELIELNYTFESDSDTEVILKAYHKWGIDAVNKFNGMFVIVLYDRDQEKIILIRDRAGIKPLFWYLRGNYFLFSSEIKSFHQFPNFHKEIDKAGLSLYFQYGYIPQPHTIFKNTFKLRSGHFIEVDLNTKKITETKYWDVIDYYNKPKLNIDKKEATIELEKLLTNSFEYRMVSDVPVGVFLSGGYDSTAVASILQKERSEKIKTFTIGFDEKGFDEAPFAKNIANFLGTDHTEYYCTQKEALDIIPNLVEIFDEPFADLSAIPTILVSKIAREQVTVALSADGGDEAFAGYNKYVRSLKYLEYLKKNSFSQFLLKNSLPLLMKSKMLDDKYNNKIGRIVETLKKHESESVLKFMCTMNQEEINKYFLKKPNHLKTFFDDENELLNSNDNLNKMLAIDYKTYLVDDILTKVDRSTMSVSLEGREPLLDYRIIEFSSQLPSSLKSNKGNSKMILKDIVHNYIPKELMDRPKTGFAAPMQIWFKDELENMIKLYLNNTRLRKENIFDIDEIEKLKTQYFKEPFNPIYYVKIWNFIIFEMWYERWM